MAGDYPIAQYTLETYLNGSHYHTANIDSGSTNYTLDALAEGHWEWRVRAFDTHSNPGPWSDTWAFTIDKSMPSFEITNPVNGSVVSGTQTITAKITDPSGIKKVLMTLPTKSGNKTYVYEEEAINNSLTKSGDTYSVTVDTKELFNDGVVYVVLRATDNVGNTRYWNNNANNRQHSFTVDNTAPSVPTLLSPANGVPVNGSSPIANAWEGVADAHHYIYESYNVNNSGECNLSSVRWTESYTDSKTNSRVLADGLKFCWRVKAVDAAGNESDWSELWMTIADNVAPVVAINAPTNDDFLSGTINLSGTVTDANPLNSYFRIEKEDGTFVRESLFTDGRTLHEFTWDTTTVEDGVYKIFFEARDKAGNKDGSRAAPGPSVAVITVTVDNAAPTVTIVSYSQAGNKIQPDVDIDDASPLSYKWVATNNPATPATFDDDVLNPVFTVGANTIDTYEFELTVTDAAGNSTTVPFSFTYTAPAPETDTTEGATEDEGTGDTSGTVSNVTTTNPTTGEPVNIPNDEGEPNDEAVESATTTAAEGASTEAENTETELIENAASTSKFLGLGWWWLAVLGALVFLWLLFGRRTAEDKN